MDKDHLIDSFFQQSLNESEKVQFDKELASNSEFAREFAFQKSLRKVLHQKERASLKAELKTYAITTKTIMFRSWLAAAILLFVGFGTWVYFTTRISNSDLYAAYYQPFPNTINPIVRGENSKSESSEAFQAYDSEDYVKAEKLFIELNSRTPSNSSFFYLGICLLQNEKIDEAISHFENTNYKPVEPWQTYSDWYLALAYLKINKSDKAKKLLLSLSLKEGIMGKKAIELLDKL